jgi:hypothetical protein
MSRSVWNAIVRASQKHLEKAKMTDYWGMDCGPISSPDDPAVLNILRSSVKRDRRKEGQWKDGRLLLLRPSAHRRRSGSAA